MTKPSEWMPGPPPHPGWWNARVVGLTSDDLPFGLMWGWWDGERWSTFVGPGESDMSAGPQARKIGIDDGACGHVRWSHYWPEGARVPRINPKTGEVTGGSK